MEALQSLVSSRHSVRHFKSDPVPEELLRKIIELSEQAPSWCNSQPWDVYIASGESLKKIRDAFKERQDQKAEDKADIPAAHRTNYSQRGATTMANFFEYAGPFFTNNAPPLLFNAPAIIYLGLHKGHSEYMTYDLGSFAMLVQLAAKACGLDTIVAYQCVMYGDVLHSVLEIPNDEDIIIGIAIGYADEACKELQATRLPVTDILTIKH